MGLAAGYTSDVTQRSVRSRRTRRCERADHQPVPRSSDLLGAANDPLVQAVQQATAAGIIVVTSAGTTGRNPDNLGDRYGGITRPAQRTFCDLRGRGEDREHRDA